MPLPVSLTSSVSPVVIHGFGLQWEEGRPKDITSPPSYSSLALCPGLRAARAWKSLEGRNSPERNLLNFFFQPHSLLGLRRKYRAVDMKKKAARENFQHMTGSPKFHLPVLFPHWGSCELE